MKRMFTAVLAGLVLVTTTGCVSGGFKMTRSYAGFVNKQPVILRVILYILTGIIFSVTLIIDAVFYNTMDFWEGRVSQGTYQFSEDGRNYVVEHSIQPDTGLRQSRIEVLGEVTQQIVLRETADHAVDVFINGVHKGKLSDVSEAARFSSRRSLQGDAA